MNKAVHALRRAFAVAFLTGNGDEETRKLGYAVNEDGTTPLDVELDGLLVPYKRALDPGSVLAASSLA